jgi:hypothetical protein
MTDVMVERAPRLYIDSVTTIPLPPRSVAMRPLALPAEHGGWGFLFEPIALGLLVAPSWGGALVSAAAVSAFLARHPLKLAMQDALRRRSYPRTRYCRWFAGLYALAGALALASGVAIGGAQVLIPLAIVAPLAAVQLVYDARNRSRELLPELTGALAMSSIAAAVAIAGGFALIPALGIAGIIAARTLPSVLYVRSLLRHGPAWPVVAIHGLALLAVVWFASPFATAAMAILLIRAVWGLTHEPPRAQTVGWREIVFGAVTVALVAIGYGV